MASARPTGAMNLTGGQVSHVFSPVGASQQILVGDLLCDAGLLAGSTATGVAVPAGNASAQSTVAALQGRVHDSFLGVSETYRSSTVATTGTVRDFASVATTGKVKLNIGTTNSTAYPIGSFWGVGYTGATSSCTVLVDSNGISTALPVATAPLAIGIADQPVATTDQTVIVNFLGTNSTPTSGVQAMA